MIRVQQEDFDVGLEYQQLGSAFPLAGAIVAFVGRVRRMVDDGDKVKPLERIQSMTLEHYEGMTEKELLLIEAQARERWSLLEILIIHRFGRLEPGDQIVLVLTASPHRKDAFEAAQFIMDWLKTKAPFWKLEERLSGQRWVEANLEDDKAADRWS